MFPMRNPRTLDAVSPGVSVQDANRVGAQDARYTHYTALLAGYQNGILRGAKSSQMRGGFISKLKLQRITGIKGPIRNI
jgi:hypothetical protein